MNSARDADRFLELIEDSKKLIYKICFTYGRSESARHDLFQEIVLQVWKSFDRYDESKTFSTWMYRIALNTAISFVRKEQRRSEKEISIDVDMIHVEVRSSSETTHADLEFLHQQMASLDEISKAILLLKLDGKSHGEIGDVLGISPSNVGTRLGRIKAQLQNQRLIQREKDYE